MDNCRFCGSTETVEELMPQGSQNYSKISCLSCERFLKWGRKPENVGSRRDNNHTWKEMHLKTHGKFKCVWCGAETWLFEKRFGWQFQCDHIVPLSEGGKDEFENTQILCFECHEDKTARRKRVKIIRERLERDADQRHVSSFIKSKVDQILQHFDREGKIRKLLDERPDCY